MHTHRTLLDHYVGCYCYQKICFISELFKPFSVQHTISEIAGYYHAVTGYYESLKAAFIRTARHAEIERGE